MKLWVQSFYSVFHLFVICNHITLHFGVLSIVKILQFRGNLLLALTIMYIYSWWLSIISSLFFIPKCCLHKRLQFSPVGWGCLIHPLHLCREVRPLPPTSVLDMTLSILIVRLQPWRFGEYEVLLHCHCSQVPSDLKW